MTPETRHILKAKLSALKRAIETFEVDVTAAQFSDDENKDEAQAETATMLTCVEDLEEILDTDAECAVLKKELGQ